MQYNSNRHNQFRSTDVFSEHSFGVTGIETMKKIAKWHTSSILNFWMSTLFFKWLEPVGNHTSSGC